MTQTAQSRVRFLQDILSTVMEQGREFVDRAIGGGFSGHSGNFSLEDLTNRLVSSRGEASSVALAYNILQRYHALSAVEKTVFLMALNRKFAADPEAVRHAFRAFDSAPSETTLQTLAEAVEPARQEVIRRLNLAPGNTFGLVRMREDLLDRLQEEPDLSALDADFVHLFSSWFNRGFLMIRRIDWTTPAYILEKIIRYEAVHAIESWDDLRRRIEPPDRRCFAFFHPALVDEPLIFVEVALTRGIPDAIQPILTAQREILPIKEATTAVFYSISNCQKGLARISFGNFLIKQVAEELKREMPALTTFVTLSPVPGFRRWLEKSGEASSQEGRLSDKNILPDHSALRILLAQYLLEAKGKNGQPLDPVARFHLGNGARLEQLNLGADPSDKGLVESHGAMVNYFYDLAQVEQNHERYAAKGAIAASTAVRKALKSPSPQ